MWAPVIYKDIKPGYYEISDEGEIRSARTKKPHYTRTSRRGYQQVALTTTNGKVRTCQFHHVVLSAFTGGNQPDMEVDHVNCDKLDNRLSNLEWVTPKENKRRETENKLQMRCESHTNAVLNDDLVRKICELYQEGYNSKKVIKELHLKDLGYKSSKIRAVLSQIYKRKTWCDISKDYTWDTEDNKYQTYSRKDLQMMAYLILYSNLKYKEIANLFPKYPYKQLLQVIKKMAQGDRYKSIMNEVERSTTIDNFVDQMMLEGYC